MDEFIKTFQAICDGAVSFAQVRALKEKFDSITSLHVFLDGELNKLTLNSELDIFAVEIGLSNVLPAMFCIKFRGYKNHKVYDYSIDIHDGILFNIPNKPRINLSNAPWDF